MGQRFPPNFPPHLINKFSPLQGHASLAQAQAPLAQAPLAQAPAQFAQAPFERRQPGEPVGNRGMFVPQQILNSHDVRILNLEKQISELKDLVETLQLQLTKSTNNQVEPIENEKLMPITTAPDPVANVDDSLTSSSLTSDTLPSPEDTFENIITQPSPSTPENITV